MNDYNFKKVNRILCLKIKQLNKIIKSHKKYLQIIESFIFDLIRIKASIMVNFRMIRIFIISKLN